MKIKLIGGYLLLLIPSLLIAAIIWSCIAPDRFYHCWDDAPIITFLPPFAHPDILLNGQVADYFIWSKSTVYLIWFGFIAAAILLPAIPILFFRRLWLFYKRNGLLTLNTFP